MVFSSLLFTFFFLPAVLVLYYIFKGSVRNYLLLAASLFFYAYGEPRFVLIMLLMIAFDYAFALLIDGAAGKKTKKTLLVVAVAANLGVLFAYKYLGFATRLIDGALHTSLAVDIALPIGISFFTFQALSYVIDVYRGECAVQKNPFYLALYVSFFPQLIAGPIVRYKTIEKQIAERTCTLELFASGATRFFLGFGKKVVLANHLAVVSEAVFSKTNDFGAIEPVFLWLGALCYTLQIYYDFSGYSDMAIGLGRLFGFRFEENFNYPYISKGVAEFWRRWHISLGTWFRDYVYIPLGGSRVNLSAQLRNLFVVWLLTGIWHGANWTFIVWGLWHFALLVLEKYLVKPLEKPSPFRAIWRALTLLGVMLGWVMFNSASVRAGWNFIVGMFGGYRAETAGEALNLVYYCREYGAFILLGIVFATPLTRALSALCDRWRPTALLRALARPFAYGALFLWSVSFLILGVHNPFIYFHF